MIVYRITHKKYADRLVASGMENRWNMEGQMVIYTAASRALACLENLVHTSGESLSNGLYLVLEISIPDDSGKTIIKANDLPAGFRSTKSQEWMKLAGRKWYDAGKNLLLQVPSAIIPAEHNIIINTLHGKFKQVKIVSKEPFVFDDRLKR